jgi:ribosome-associated heat shock protein Hsp15
VSGSSQRIDKWLWFARIVKTRSLAAALVSGGKVRVNRQKIAKPSHPVAPGDVLTIALRGHVRVLRLLDPGTRRGPAPEARLLYEDLAAPPSDRPPPGEPEG